MRKHYDINLKNVLPANNSGSEVVLNRDFISWQDHIAGNLYLRDASGGPRYKSGQDGELLEFCLDHASQHRRPTDADKTIMLVHPFYMHLTHMNEIESVAAITDSRGYLDNLLWLLEKRPDPSQVSVVALETIHHYAAATSLLLEKGLVDRVIFTEYDSGHPLVQEELADFKHNTIFFGGGYNEFCLYVAIQDMMSRISDGQIMAIRELVLNCPVFYSSSLRPKRVEGLDKSQVISLEKALHMLQWVEAEPDTLVEPAEKNLRSLISKTYKYLFLQH